MWNLILSCAAMLILFFCILLLAFCGKRICITGSPLSQCHVVISCTPFRLHTYDKYSIYILYNMNCIFTFIQWKKIFFSWFTWWNITYMYMYIDVSRWSINKKKNISVPKYYYLLFCFQYHSRIVLILSLPPKYEQKWRIYNICGGIFRRRFPTFI